MVPLTPMLQNPPGLGQVFTRPLSVRTSKLSGGPFVAERGCDGLVGRSSTGLTRPPAIRSALPRTASILPISTKLSTHSEPSRPPVPSEAVRVEAGILKGCWARMDQVGS